MGKINKDTAMEYKRPELLEVLEKIKPGIATNQLIESMGYFFFSGTDIVSYNDKISIQHPLKTNFSLFVKANALFTIISKAKVDELTMEEKDNKLNIKAKGINAKLATISDEEIADRIQTIKTALKKAKWKQLPSNFSECVKLCAFAADKKEKDTTLSCIRLDGTQCLSTDNQRIACATLKKKIKPMFLKATEVDKLCAIEPVEYTISKAWIHFKNEKNCIFSIRKVKGGFPDFNEMFKFKGINVRLPKSILEGTDLASVLVDENSPSIEIAINKNICKISVTSDAGSIQCKSKIEYVGKPISFAINPDFLKEMLNYSTSITIADDKARLETDNFKLVTSLYVEE